MPALKNPKHERFAQNLTAGMSQTDAYEDAGYNRHRPNASALAREQNITDRVRELLKRRQTIEHQATERAIEQLAITRQRVLAELAAIGFADIRKAVEWSGGLIGEQNNSAGGDKEIFANRVRLVDSGELDQITAAAIAEVAQTPTGGLRIKFHDKLAALTAIGKFFGMWQGEGSDRAERERQETENGSRFTDKERARAILNLIERVSRSKEGPDPATTHSTT